MILKGGEISRYVARPDPDRPALLVYGQDAMRVMEKRNEAAKALTGENADTEMRVTRLAGAQIRTGQAVLLDAIKEIGFFPGPRVVLVDDATDAGTAAIRAAVEAWAPGDAVILVTAGILPKSSSLRKYFESHDRAAVAPIYNDPPDMSEVQKWLQEEGLGNVPPEVQREFVQLAQAVDPGDLRQIIRKAALYKYGDDAPLTTDEIALLTPATVETGLDELLHAVAERKSDAVVALVRRITGQGTRPTALCIAALRHFRTLYLATLDPAGPDVGLTRMRPPVFGPRKTRMARQARDWGTKQLEGAISQLLAADLALRGASAAPQTAFVERVLIRLALGSRGNR